MVRPDCKALSQKPRDHLVQSDPPGAPVLASEGVGSSWVLGLASPWDLQCITELPDTLRSGRMKLSDSTKSATLACSFLPLLRYHQHCLFT